MLGGYYLGQLYLGISGLVRYYILDIDTSNHSVTFNGITLTQLHNLILYNSLNNLTSDSLSLTQLHNILVNSAINRLDSDNITILQFHNLLVATTTHSVSSKKILKIFNWDEMNKFFGIYIKEYESLGGIDTVNSPDAISFIVPTTQSGSLSSIEITNQGTYIKDNNKQGIL